jgi:hypothetical protein
MGNIPQGALGCNCRDRFLQRRSTHAERAGSVLRALFINLETRRVEIAGIVQQPDGRWIQQIARNVVDVDHGSLNDCCYLIHDRDPLFTEAFGRFLRLLA